MMKKYIWFIVIFCVISAKPSFAKVVATFEGSVDFLRPKFNVQVNFVEKGVVSASLEEISQDNFSMLLNLERMNILGSDVSSNIGSSFQLERLESTGFVRLHGNVWSRYSLIDYKPVRDFSGRFEVKDNVLELIHLFFGAFDCSGKINLVYPNKLDMTLKINSMDMNDFLYAWSRNKNIDSSGDVIGEIKLSGELDKIKVKARLASFDGYVKDLEFDSLYLNLEGYYPEVYVSDTLVSTTNGISFKAEGPIDLSDSLNFRKQIKALSISPVVNNTESKIEWTIKKLKTGDSGATELKYLLRDNSGFGGGDENSDMFGLERTVEF